jgi:hypothetical protein
LRVSTQGEWTIYDSNSWRRIGLKNDYRETLWPCRLHDGHPDLSGVNRDDDLALLMFLQNNAPALLEVVKAAGYLKGHKDEWPHDFNRMPVYIKGHMDELFAALSRLSDAPRKE